MAVLAYKSFEPMSVLDGTQVILEFGDYDLSIVSHSGSYGGNEGLYEIAVIKNGSFKIMPGITEAHDTVKGWLTEAAVDTIIKKMFFVTGVSPRQV